MKLSRVISMASLQVIDSQDDASRSEFGKRRPVNQALINSLIK